MSVHDVLVDDVRELFLAGASIVLQAAAVVGGLRVSVSLSVLVETAENVRPENLEDVEEVFGSVERHLSCKQDHSAAFRQNRT